MSKQWQPVTNGEIINSAGDVLAIYTGADGAHFLESHTDAGVAKYNLLGELMVCKRVEVEPEPITPEPITPEALKREGWKYDAGYDYPEPETFYIFKIAKDAAVSASFVDGECKGIDVHQDDGFLGWSVQSVSFPGCDSMQKLRALVEMLGGAQ